MRDEVTEDMSRIDRPRRPTVTVDLGDEALELLDRCVSLLQAQGGYARITRSAVMRRGIKALYGQLVLAGYEADVQRQADRCSARVKPPPATPP